jgi:hypothetical protein
MMSLSAYGHDGSGYLLTQNGEYLGGGSGLLQQVPLGHELSYKYPSQSNNYENYEVCDTYAMNYDPNMSNMSDQYGQTVDQSYYMEQSSYVLHPSQQQVPEAAYWSTKQRAPEPSGSNQNDLVSPSYVNQAMQQSPHSSNQTLPQIQGQLQSQVAGAAGGHAHVNVVGQGQYNVAHPTVVRYSPDEGYAEEPANPNFVLEGTEV